MAREKREEEEIKELQRFLDEEDVTWEVRKQKERELGKKKRRRQSETEEEPGQSGRRAAKKLKFTLLKEDWGTRVEEEDDRGLEDGNEGKPAVPVLLAKRSRGGQVSPSSKLTSSQITDYFKPTLPVIMEDGMNEMVWEEEEFCNSATTPMRHLRSEGVPKKRNEDEGLTADVSSSGKLVDWWGSL